MAEEVTQPEASPQVSENDAPLTPHTRPNPPVEPEAGDPVPGQEPPATVPGPQDSEQADEEAPKEPGFNTSDDLK